MKRIELPQRKVDTDVPPSGFEVCDIIRSLLFAYSCCYATFMGASCTIGQRMPSLVINRELVECQLEPLPHHLVDVFARMVHDSEGARLIATRAGFPPQHLPEFRSALGFWSSVVEQAANGRIELEALLREMLEHFPCNAELGECCERMKAMLAPRRGVAQPERQRSMRHTHLLAASWSLGLTLALAMYATSMSSRPTDDEDLQAPEATVTVIDSPPALPPTLDQVSWPIADALVQVGPAVEDEVADVKTPSIDASVSGERRQARRPRFEKENQSSDTKLRIAIGTRIKASCGELLGPRGVDISFVIEPSGRIVGVTSSPRFEPAGECALAQFKETMVGARNHETPIVIEVR